MADLRCAECDIIMQTGEKAVGKFKFLYNKLPSGIAFKVHPSEIVYVPGTIRHAKCEEDE